MWIVYYCTDPWITIRSVFLYCLCVILEQPQCRSISVMSWWLSDYSVCGIRVGLQGQDIISQKRWDRHWRLLSLRFNGPQALNLHGQTSWGLKLKTHTHLVQSLKMSGSVPLLPSMISWHAQGYLYRFFQIVLQEPTAILYWKVPRDFKCSF